MLSTYQTEPASALVDILVSRSCTYYASLLDESPLELATVDWSLDDELAALL